MFGLPRETPEMVKETVQFVIDLDIDYVAFSPYHLLEGTAIKKIALQQGCRVNHDNVNPQLPAYVPDTYENAAQLNRVTREAYKSVLSTSPLYRQSIMTDQESIAVTQLLIKIYG